METSSTEFVKDLEKELGLGIRLSNFNGLKNFLDYDISNISAKDQEVIKQVTLEQLRKSIPAVIARRPQNEILEHRRFASSRRLAQRLTQKSFENALIVARRELLAKNSGISIEAKNFIDDHCPCR